MQKTTENYAKILKEVLRIGENTRILVARLRYKDKHEKIRLHVEERGELKPPLTFFYSDRMQSLKRLSDGGCLIAEKYIIDIIKSIKAEYNDLPVLMVPEGLGWQTDQGKNITGFAASQTIGADGIEVVRDEYSETLCPLSAGKFDAAIFNQYMSGNVVRQTILLHQLSAPILALADTENPILSLRGTSSKGKTSVGLIAQSLSVNPDFSELCQTMNGTLGAIEINLSSINGVSVLLDDTSLGEERMNMQALIYKLANGKVKKRIRNTGGAYRISDNGCFRTSILITTEESIFAKIDPNKEGVNGRLLEIPVCGSILFDSEKQCCQLMRYCERNYGHAVPALVKEVFRIGIEAVISQIEKETLSIAKGMTNETVIKRQSVKLAAMVVTARLAKKSLGLEFDGEAIVDYVQNLCYESLEDSRAERKENKALTAIAKQVREKAEHAIVTKHKGRNYYFVSNNEINRIILDNDFRLRDAKMKLQEQGILYGEEGQYSFNVTSDGKPERGYLIEIELLDHSINTEVAA